MTKIHGFVFHKKGLWLYCLAFILGAGYIGKEAMASMAHPPIVFTFSETDKELVRTEAMRRQAINEWKGLKGRNGGPEDGGKALCAHMLGAAGELAVATLLGLREFLYAETEAKRGSFDLPPNIDAKTRSRHWHDLICQLDEAQGKVLVLVTMENKTCLVHGWISSDDAMREQWRKDPAKGRPAFFVPKSKLKSMHLLSAL